jgi:hypothetical protein
MNTKNEYLFLFRGTDWHKGLSPEEMQEVAGQWMGWFKRLSAEGKVLGGNPLDATGKIVSGKSGRVVVDGPFAESKEAIGGYFLVKADSIEEATAMAKECPGLAFGARVEVRPLMEQCPMSAAVEHELAGATA